MPKKVPQSETIKFAGQTKTCSHCPAAGDVVEVFGIFKDPGGIYRPQAQCRECRKTGAMITQRRQAAEKRGEGPSVLVALMTLAKVHGPEKATRLVWAFMNGVHAFSERAR